MTNPLKHDGYFRMFFLIVGLLIVEFLITKDLPFFWDAISKSSRANWIYETGLSQFIVPTDINSGHPPLWISLLATSWTIFGKSLISSRFLLLIVNFGVLYQIIKLCKNNFVTGVSCFAILLVYLEPTFLAQTISLNNDMLLLFFTLFSLNTLIKSKPLLFAIALTGLLLTNLRGIYLFSAILILHAVYWRLKLIPKNKRLFWAYGFSALIFMVFCAFQYDKLGWFIITQNENFNQHRQTTGLKSILINSVVYIKSYLEYGRFIIFLIITPLLYRYFKNKVVKSPEIERLFWAFMIIAGVLFFGMVPFSNPMGDRYFIVCYMLAIILMINLMTFFNVKRKMIIISIVALSFITGHFWIYPATISQSWDSSLAHLRYYSLEEDLEDYLQQHNIPHKDIGTRIRLNERESSTLQDYLKTQYYADFDLESNTYVLLSNIENYTKDDEYLFVKNNWILIEDFQDEGVFISLYKKPQE